MAPTEREENSAFYPQCREIPSSGISLPERRDRSPFSQAGSLRRDPPLQREKSLSQPSSPWGEHVLNMLPKETARGSSTCRLYTPSTHSPEPIYPRYPLRHVPVKNSAGQVLQANLLQPYACTYSLPHTGMCRFQEACTEYSIQQSSMLRWSPDH